MAKHFVLVLKIEKVETRGGETSPQRRVSSSGTVADRKIVAEMTSVTLRASSYEGILLKAEKLLQLERDLGEDGQIKDARPHEDEEDDEPTERF